MTPREIYYNLRPRGMGNSQRIPKDWIPILGLTRNHPINWMEHAPEPTPSQLIQLKDIAHESGIRLVNESKPFVTAYTDGSGYGKGKQPCGYAAILRYGDQTKEVSGGAKEGP